MSSEVVERLIMNAIHSAFVKYPEGDGGPHLDYEWIQKYAFLHLTSRRKDFRLCWG